MEAVKKRALWMCEEEMLYSLIERNEPALGGLECCEGFLITVS